MSNHTDFYIRRIHSLTGIVPIGLFLLEHIFTNSTVLFGKGTFNAAVANLAAIPAAVLIPMEIIFIAIPLLFHGLYGLLIYSDAKNNVKNYGYARNWQFYLQRFTAIIVVVFLLYHVVTLRFLNKAAFTAAPWDYMHLHLSNPLVLAFYAIALVATVFHFTNGMFTFCITWGITKGPRAQRVVNWMMIGLCILLSAIGLAALTKFL